MVTRDFINIISLLLATAFTASGQCTDGCTVCTDTDLVCEGLDKVPPLDTLDAFSTDEQRISLTNGTIDEIPADYFNLSNVVSIDLSNNQLTTLNMHSFEYARDLQTIDLTGNPIVCNSSIDWLQKWNRLNLSNTVIGNCAGSGQTIETYLADTPGSLVDVRFAASLVFDRHCHEITVPFTVVGKFTSNLEYRAYIESTSSNVDISVADEYIAVPVGTKTSEINIDITNRGEIRNEVDTLLNIIPKYPVSYKRSAVILLKNGVAGCKAPVPVITKTTPTSPVTQTMPEREASEPGGDTFPNGSMTTDPGAAPGSPSTKKGSAALWVIVAIAVVAVIAVIAGIAFWCRR